MSEPSERLENLRDAYQILKRNHQNIIPPAELATAEQSLASMVDSLTDVCHQSSDPPTAPTLVVTMRTSSGGRRRVDIDRDVLAEALNLRGPTHLQDIFGVCSRTIRRRALEYELVEPGAPLYTDTPEPDGTVSCTCTSPSVLVSTITDDELDAILAASWVTVYPESELQHHISGSTVLLARLELGIFTAHHTLAQGQTHSGIMMASTGSFTSKS
ncbi:hypothetical protein K438DRAFT_1996655 [Mycena galopus ATCC 62051]|nr:hypothetical protein K438DRAFT_1996655 [Mycena galopus ATCC 62051]